MPNIKPIYFRGIPRSEEDQSLLGHIGQVRIEDALGNPAVTSCGTPTKRLKDQGVEFQYLRPEPNNNDFGWGYLGSGPTDLAAKMARVCLPPGFDLRFDHITHQCVGGEDASLFNMLVFRLRDAFVAGLPKDGTSWRVPVAEIRSRLVKYVHEYERTKPAEPRIQVSADLTGKWEVWKLTPAGRHLLQVCKRRFQAEKQAELLARATGWKVEETNTDLHPDYF